MCGILAFFSTDRSRSADRDEIIRATGLMAHRGPDDWGIHLDREVGLGHRRLSIIDLAAGHQPMFNEDGSISIVFNGEIYNFAEIRELLLARGHQFKTRSDTEVILHAYEEWGTDSVQRFNGMFAWALWDRNRRLLWCVRDRLGIKPLYYVWDGKTFACASEAKPLLHLGPARPELNERVLDAYFTLGYVPAPETCFRGILKVKPGHFLEVKDGQLQDIEYWDFAQSEPANLGYEATCEKVGGLLKDCVGKCLVSDVPLGVFLSGGLDSSAVVAMMHELVVDPISTFTVGYDGRRDEGEEPYAQLVAKRFKTRHHLFTLAPKDFYESVRLLVRQCEEPLVEPASIALYHLASLAAKSVKVLLSGEGSDEVFAGYSLYQSMRRIGQVQEFLPPRILRLLGGLRSILRREKHRKYLDWLGLPLEQRYRGTSTFLTKALKRDYYSATFQTGSGDYLEQTFTELFDRVSHVADPVNKMQYVDTKTWLVDDLLLKADKMTMAASVELRVPFLDHRLVEFAASVPSEFKCLHGQGKRLLKSSMTNRLPAEIVHRKKMGFPVPVRRWFGQDLLPVVRERLSDRARLPWIEQKTVQRLIGEHARNLEDHSNVLMSLLVIQAWQEEYLGR